MDVPNKSRRPGPLWAWILAFVIFTEGINRLVIGWPIPPAKDFHFGNALVRNFGANFVLGLPILAAYWIMWRRLNRRHP